MPQAVQAQQMQGPPQGGGGGFNPKQTMGMLGALGPMVGMPPQLAGALGLLGGGDPQQVLAGMMGGQTGQPGQGQGPVNPFTGLPDPTVTPGGEGAPPPSQQRPPMMSGDPMQMMGSPMQGPPPIENPFTMA